MPLVPCEVVIPLLSGLNRVPWPARKIPDWEHAVAHLFGGRSPIAQGVVGLWNNPAAPLGQHIVPDPQNRYKIVVEASRVDELREFMRFACVHFEQQCIYFETPGNVEFLANPLGWPPPIQ